MDIMFRSPNPDRPSRNTAQPVVSIMTSEPTIAVDSVHLSPNHRQTVPATLDNRANLIAIETLRIAKT
ncbi:MAG: hypothetical protein ABIP17_02400 [Ilumatobacteraceae bacterium]